MLTRNIYKHKLPDSNFEGQTSPCTLWRLHGDPPPRTAAWECRLRLGKSQIREVSKIPECKPSQHTRESRKKNTRISSVEGKLLVPLSASCGQVRFLLAKVRASGMCDRELK